MKSKSQICLDNQTGFLIKQGHENAAAERLLLARDPKLLAEFGQRGQAFVRANFGVEKMVEMIYALYEQLIRSVEIRN